MGVIFHFLNVGSGDCTIAHFPKRTRNKDNSLVDERIMMVDICHHEDDQEYDNIIDYYKRNFIDENGNVKPIFRFICTHPHQDHICGIDKLFKEKGVEILNFWDLEHDFEPEELDKHPTHKDDWSTYKLIRMSDKSPTVIRTSREDSPQKYWNDDEDQITVLSPSDYLKRYAHYTSDGKKRAKHEVEIDEMSYALMIKINERKVILASDGRSTPFWDDIYTNCKLEIVNCQILKAGHHGHEAAFHEKSVKLMDPVLIVFSNSSKEDKDNGAYSLYSNALPNALILKTCDHGVIKVKVPYDSSEKVTYWTEK